MTAAVALREEQHLSAAAPVTPMDMLNQAVSSGANIEVVSRLMDLHERWQATQARRDFDEALAAAKSEIKPVVRNKVGHNNKRYADFAAYAREIDPVLAQHGLSYRFRTEQTDRIHVTCVLSHRGGHSETNTLAGPADASGSKNAIQAIGSTLTYLQRYTLTQALGLAASDEDDDGQAAGVASDAAHTALEQIAALDSLAACDDWHGKQASGLKAVLNAKDLAKVEGAFMARRRLLRGAQ